MNAIIKNKKRLIRYLALAFSCLIYILYFIRSKTDYTYLMIFFTFLCIGWKSITPAMQSETFSIIILRSVLSIIFSFQIWGFELFLKDILWNTSIWHLLVYLSCTICTYSFLCGIDGFVFHQKKKARTGDSTHPAFVFFISLVFLGTVWSLVAMLFYPGNMTSDNTDQWVQALGYNQINDWHPFINQLYYRTCIKIFGPNPIYCIILAAWVFAFVLARWAVFFSSKTSAWKVILAEYIFALSPSTIYMVTTPSKDMYFAVFMTWELLLLVRLHEITAEKFLQSIESLEFVFVSLILSLIRHNGKIIVFLIIGIIVITCYRAKIRTKILGLSVSLILLASFLVMQNPVKYHFCRSTAVTQKSAMFRPLISPYASALCSEIVLSQDTMDYLRKILPLDAYKKYNPYNSDTIFFEPPYPDYSKVSLKSAMRYYIKLLFRHPFIVIKDRLDGTNLMWDAFSHIGVPHGRYQFCVSVSESMIWIYEQYPDVFLSSRRMEGQTTYTTLEGGSHIIAKWIRAFDNIPVANCLFWRAGIYTSILLWGIYCLIQKNRTDALWIYVLPIVTLVTLFLIVGWQLYQYYWWLTISSPLLLWISLILDEKDA